MLPLRRAYEHKAAARTLESLHIVRFAATTWSPPGRARDALHSSIGDIVSQRRKGQTHGRKPRSTGTKARTRAICVG
jgi:hypothetical protein